MEIRITEYLLAVGGKNLTLLCLFSVALFLKIIFFNYRKIMRNQYLHLLTFYYKEMRTKQGIVIMKKNDSVLELIGLPWYSGS